MQAHVMSERGSEMFSHVPSSATPSRRATGSPPAAAIAPCGSSLGLYGSRKVDLLPTVQLFSEVGGAKYSERPPPTTTTTPPPPSHPSSGPISRLCSGLNSGFPAQLSLCSSGRTPAGNLYDAARKRLLRKHKQIPSPRRMGNSCLTL